MRHLGCERFAGSARFLTIRWATGSDERDGPDKTNEHAEQEIGKQSLNFGQDSLLSRLYVGVPAKYISFRIFYENYFFLIKMPIFFLPCVVHVLPILSLIFPN